MCVQIKNVFLISQLKHVTIKMFIFRSLTDKVLVRLENRENPDQTVSALIVYGFCQGTDA